MLGLCAQSIAIILPIYNNNDYCLCTVEKYAHQYQHHTAQHSTHTAHSRAIFNQFNCNQMLIYITVSIRPSLLVFGFVCCCRWFHMQIIVTTNISQIRAHFLIYYYYVDIFCFRVGGQRSNI